MMLLQIVIKIIICLILTIVIEYIPIVFFLNIPKKYFIAVNVLTNVVANVIFVSYDILNAKSVGVINRWQLFVGLEIIICIVEIYLYYIYYKKKLIKNLFKIVGLTILANMLSVMIGGVILDKVL